MKIKDHNLCLVLTEGFCGGHLPAETARLAISGGIDMLQMREKDRPRSELIKLGRELCGFCKADKVKFIVNDDPLLAREVDADGVHLGQEDLERFTIKEARNILGAGKIIGLSTSSVGEVEKTNSGKIDYIGFGPVFPTTVKDRCVGTKDIEKVLEIAECPVFFIGGINLANIGELLEKGARNIAVIRAISQAADIISAVKKFKEKMEEARDGKIT